MARGPRPTVKYHRHPQSVPENSAAGAGAGELCRKTQREAWEEKGFSNDLPRRPGLGHSLCWRVPEQALASAAPRCLPVPRSHHPVL